MEAIGISESKNFRTQVILAFCLGGLYALVLLSIGNPAGVALYGGLFLMLEVFIGGRMMTTVFRFFQPKNTLSLVPLTILILQTLILTGLLYFLISKLPLRFQPMLFLPNFWLHTLYVFLLSWIFFYEWWFLKNDLRNAKDTQRLLQLQDDLKNAEIQNIQQNIQPHFLFNSLNSISSLTITAPEEAQKMVVLLSDFLRHSVVKNQKMFVSLQEELEQIQRYLDIEQIRFSHRLRFELSHQEDNNTLEIPAMILQPLIENAIKFGLYGQTGQVDIKLKCERKGRYLFVKISNPVDENHTIKKGTGFGIKSIQKKLYLLFAENNLLQTHKDGHVFITQLKIPLKNESNFN